MKRLILGCLLLCSLAFGWAARKEAPDTISVRRAFVDFPVDVLDLLPRTTRLDMLDYFDADSIYSAPNAMEGTSELIAVGPDYLKVRVTPVSTLELKVLRAGSADVVASVYTVGGGDTAADSDLRFYDASLQPLPLKKFFSVPALADFFSLKAKGAPDRKELENLVSFPTIAYSLSEYTPELVGRLTVGSFLSREADERISPWKLDALRWVWRGGKFRRE